MRPLHALSLALLLATSALAAEPTEPDADDGDVVASGIVHAPPEVVAPRLADLDEVILVAPERCFRRWDVGPQVVGQGATFRVVYLIEAWRRRLSGSVTKVVPGERVEWDHEGNRGFLTRWSFEPVEEGTRVTAHTFILVPPRPFRRYYANRVKPAWTRCYVDLIEALDARVSATWRPAPPEPPPAAPPADSPAEPAEPDGSDAPPRP